MIEASIRKQQTTVPTNAATTRFRIMVLLSHLFIRRTIIPGPVLTNLHPQTLDTVWSKDPSTPIPKRGTTLVVPKVKQDNLVGATNIPTEPCIIVAGKTHGLPWRREGNVGNFPEGLRQLRLRDPAHQVLGSRSSETLPGLSESEP